MLTLKKISDLSKVQFLYNFILFLIIMNSILEYILGYKFKTTIEIFYFIIITLIILLKIIQDIMKKNYTPEKINYFLFVIISLIWCGKFYLITLVLYLFFNVIRIKKSAFKKIITIILNTLLLVLLSLWIWLISILLVPDEVHKTVYSNNNVYVAIVVKDPVMYTTVVYAGLNVSFGTFGEWSPWRKKYVGEFDELSWPSVEFLENSNLKINGVELHPLGFKFIDDETYDYSKKD